MVILLTRKSVCSPLAKGHPSIGSCKDQGQVPLLVGRHSQKVLTRTYFNSSCPQSSFSCVSPQSQFL